MKNILITLLMSNILLCSQWGTPIQAQIQPIENACLPDQQFLISLDSATIVCRSNSPHKGYIDHVTLIKLIKIDAKQFLEVMILVSIAEHDTRTVYITETNTGTKNDDFKKVGFITNGRKFYRWDYSIEYKSLVEKYHLNISQVFDILERYPRNKSVIEEF